MKNSPKHLSFDFARLQDDQTFNNIELFNGSYTNYKFKPHFHEAYTIIFVEEGIADYSFGKNSLKIPAGSFVIFNPFEVHGGKSISNQPWKFKSIYIPESVINDLGWKTQGDKAPIIFSQIEIKDCTLFELGIKAFNSLAAVENFEDSGQLLKEFLSQLINNYSLKFSKEPETTDNTDNKIVSIVKNYLHDHYLEEFSLHQLASMTGCDKFRLIKKFKKYHSLPPNQYLLNLRIEKAKTLLLNRHSSTDVAYQLGFFDQSHFIRHFKQIIGLTPRQYSSRVKSNSHNCRTFFI